MGNPLTNNNLEWVRTSHSASSHLPDPYDAVIELKGVRTHNLKGIDARIAHGAITVITGPSGSGKSSLAFDTLYAEGQRRYVESLSAYTRQFLDRMDRPDVEAIAGIPPAIAVERKPPAKTSRSTVGTVTEILDYLRLLFARVAELTCPGCERKVVRHDSTAAVEELLDNASGARAVVTFPVGRPLSPERLAELRTQAFYRLTSDGRSIMDLHDEEPPARSRKKFFAITDRLRVSEADRTRLAEALDVAFHEGNDKAMVFIDGEKQRAFSRGLHCADCDRSFKPPGPLTFSFNSPIGACPRCRGFGDIIDIDPDRVIPDGSLSLDDGAIAPWRTGAYKRWQRRLLNFAKENAIPADRPFRKLTADERRSVFEGGKGFPGVRGFFKKLEKKIYKLHVRVLLSRYRRYVPCDACGGARLGPESLAYRIGGQTIAEITARTAVEAGEFFDAIRLDGVRAGAADPLVREILRRLDVMVRAGLDYITLDRPSRTLSGGEYQRIMLAGALGSGLVGTLYVLDEPSIGLHARDTERLLGILSELRDAGNTVVVVEHDRDIILGADHVIDLGPGAGEHGGRMVFDGTPAALLSGGEGATADYLGGRSELPAAARRDLSRAKSIGIRDAATHNLKKINVDIPLGGLVCVTGVSGSGKSSLIQETLYRAYRASKGESEERPGAHRTLVGRHHVSDVHLIDQSPIGRTPRSNPVTYMKAFDGIRRLFAETRQAREKRLKPGDFSFNVAGGRCDACEGAGRVKVELQFLADLFVVCDACDGSRYQDHIQEVRYRGRTITEVLNMTVEDSIQFFADTPTVARPLWHLQEVGLGYLRLGQPATTLSGGEAQRLKIARHLARRVDGRCLFILDEPTTGLHLCDIRRLLSAFERLIRRGHSVLVVEHNLDVVARADHVIDLGPEGGHRGGEVVAVGTPEAIARSSASITGQHLKRHFKSYGKPAGQARRGRRARTAKPKGSRRS